MRILLLDEGQHQSLYFSRKLQECMALNVDSADTFTVAIASSNTRRQKIARLFPVTVYPTPAPTSSNYVDCIEGLAKNFDVIIPISNNCLPIAYDPKTTWSQKVFPAMSADNFALLFDKFASTQLAKTLGIQCPTTIAVDTIEQLDSAINTLGLPIVLKQHTGWAGSGVRICHSLEELEKEFRLFQQETNSHLFCQQYIQGTPCLAGGLFLDGNPIRIYCANHSFSYPPTTGSSKSVTSCTANDMQQALLDFCRATHWTGLGNLDFMRGDNGELYFLEMNPRIWGSIAASEDAGVDMIKPLLDILRGQTPASSLHYGENINSVLFPQYLLTLCQQGGYGNLWRVISAGSLWRSAPWQNRRYLSGYVVKIIHAWLHGFKRTVRVSLGLHNDTELPN